MDKILQSFAMAANRMLEGTGMSFLLVIYRTDRPINTDEIGFVADKNTSKEQAADVCQQVSNKLRSRIIH